MPFYMLKLPDTFFSGEAHNFAGNFFKVGSVHLARMQLLKTTSPFPLVVNIGPVLLKTGLAR